EAAVEVPVPPLVLRPGDDHGTIAGHGDRGPPDVEAGAGHVDRLAGLAVGEAEQADLVAAPLRGELGEALGPLAERFESLGPDRPRSASGGRRPRAGAGPRPRRDRDGGAAPRFPRPPSGPTRP